MNDSHRYEAISATSAMESAIRSRSKFGRPGRPHPNNPLKSWLLDWLAAPEQRASGQALSPLLRLKCQDSLCEILSGDGPYVTDQMGMVVTLRAIKPVDVLISSRTIVRSSSRDGADVEGGVPETQKEIKHFEIGDEFEVPVNYAILALRRHNLSAWPPTMWDSSSALPTGDALEEVAYSTNVRHAASGRIEGRRKSTKRSAQ